MAGKSNKMVELDWIRGLSALLIVLYHYTARYQEVIGHIIEYPITISWGCSAVNVFFFLTGFLTAHTMNQRITPPIFLRKRITRLYPTYWVCIIITTIVTTFFFKLYAPSSSTVLINVTMFQGFLGVRNVDGVYWTLQYELHFYIFVLAVLFLKGNKYSNLRLLSLIWLSIAMLLAGLLTLHFSDCGHITILIGKAIMLKYCPPFIGGVLVHSLKQQKSDFWAYLGLAICFVVSFLVQPFDYFLAFVAVSFLVLILSLRKSDFNALLKQIFIPFSFLAKISYPLFLLHQYIGWTIIYYMEHKYNMIGEIWVFIPIIFVIFLAGIIHFYVEQPLLKIFKRDK